MIKRHMRTLFVDLDYHIFNIKNIFIQFGCFMSTAITIKALLGQTLLPFIKGPFELYCQQMGGQKNWRLTNHNSQN